VRTLPHPVPHSNLFARSILKTPAGLKPAGFLAFGVPTPSLHPGNAGLQAGTSDSADNPPPPMLRQNLRQHLAMHVRQPEIAPLKPEGRSHEPSVGGPCSVRAVGTCVANQRRQLPTFPSKP
ncbi:MAG TPA: hypothetical protein PLN52_25850, partial [Opitutaceae bacterium]|nr:hypothetical protein [Opitutaceae bacterium]